MTRESAAGVYERKPEDQRCARLTAVGRLVFQFEPGSESSVLLQLALLPSAPPLFLLLPLPALLLLPLLLAVLLLLLLLLAARKTCCSRHFPHPRVHW